MVVGYKFFFVLWFDVVMVECFVYVVIVEYEVCGLMLWLWLSYIFYIMLYYFGCFDGEFDFCLVVLVM